MNLNLIFIPVIVFCLTFLYLHEPEPNEYETVLTQEEN